MITKDSMHQIAPALMKLAVPIDSIHELPGNPRQGDDAAVQRSLIQFGQLKPIVVRADTRDIVAGNTTWRGARAAGWDKIAALVTEMDDATAAAFALADNRTHDLGTYDDAALAALIASIGTDDAELLAATGYTDDDLTALINSGNAPRELQMGGLVERFGIPPFSVINGRTGDWMTRKKAWVNLGIQSELGRGESLVYDSPQSVHINWFLVKNQVEAELGRRVSDQEMLEKFSDRLKKHIGTSVFDAALCELLYRWFAPPGGSVIDAWAGGSVRGIVAGLMGHAYTGIDLSAKQIEANRSQTHIVTDNPHFHPGNTITEPTWIEGDSRTALTSLDPEQFDFTIGCPPYYDLEVYSDNPADLSTMKPDDFDAAMADTMIALAKTLKADTFAAFVVSNVRDKNGFLIDMRACMNNAARLAGMKPMSDIIYLTPIGTGAMRAPRAFSGTRTVVRIHQEVLVYCKGDRKRAAAKLAPITIDDFDLPDPDEEGDDNAVA